MTNETTAPQKPTTRRLTEIAPPVPKADLDRDLAKCELMLDSNPEREQKGMKIYRGIGRDIPNLVLELGRLREETFRTVGEGSGLARDNDSFDEYYDHFVAWDKAKGEITGAYRIGRADEILSERGPNGLYTTTLFEFESLLSGDFKEGTLEAGRSFVRPEFQRGLSLVYIWMALARFIAANPRYKNLMGPVSISNEFQDNSKNLMVSYLMANFPHEKSELVDAKNPPVFESNMSPEELTAVVNSALSLGDLQEFVRRAEGNPKAQIPQLIKLYLELGVRFLAFNRDDDFNTIDGLIWLDVTAMPDAVGNRYFGEDGWRRYLSFHGKC
ncbi:MAG TPA: GNAT family N-acyltransferase [Bdellovibrionales bacterium]|nr:GNAT family N-acyltransferase [Bdellovibrionales bacterium]